MSADHEMEKNSGSPAAFARVVIVRGSLGDTTPVYSVVINGGGQVLYKGRSHVVRKGRHEWQLSDEQIQAVGRAIQDSGVLKMGPNTTQGPTDNPKLTSAIKLPGAKPVVVDNGQDEGLLESFVARVEKLTGAHDYVRDS